MVVGYILVLINWSGHTTVLPQDYTSLEFCQAAGKAAEPQFKWTCIPEYQ